MERFCETHSFTSCRELFFLSFPNLFCSTSHVPLFFFFFPVQCRYWKRARNAECESERYNLYRHWARFLCFYKEQPLNLIR